MSVNKKIIILGVLTEFLYLLLFLVEPIRKRLNDPSLVLSVHNIYFFITALLVVVFIFYVCASRLIINGQALKIAIVFFIIFNATLLFVWPLTSIDVFTYIHTSRVLSVHHANPYLTSFDSFSDDAFAPLIKNCWSSLPTPYAPLFTIISSVLTFLGQKSLFLSLFLFKFLFISLNIASCYLIHKIFKNSQATFLYAWNPLLLFEFGVNAHSDILTIFFLLISIFYIFCRPYNYKNYLISIFLLWCSILIKFITIVFLPIMVLIFLKRASTIKEKCILIMSTVIISVTSVVIFYLPFWHGIETFSRILSHLNQIYIAWFFSSLVVFVISITLVILRVNNFLNIAAISGKIIFLLLYFVILVKIFITKNKNLKENIIKYFLVSLIVFYLTFFTWFMPWYLTVLLVMLIISFSINKKAYYFWATHIVTLYGILYYLFLR
ncbi:hypothetical protein ACFLZ9_01730 [Patescibacteria group bacterium]